MGESMGYQWLYNEAGEAINKMVEDYDIDRANGWSIYEDLRDLSEVDEPIVDNTLACPKCGRICKSKLGYSKHVPACKG